MSTLNIHARLDVSHLPESGFGPSTPLWWGNTLLLLIETAMFALLGATYFYLHMNYQEWPPNQPMHDPPLYHTLPDLWPATWGLVVLLIGCLPAALAHISALKLKTWPTRIGLVLTIAAGVAAAVIRWYEFPGLHFRWDDNAYGSITWFILGMHLFHILTITLETLVMASYALFHKLEAHRAEDITLTSIYYYWVAGVWAVFYVVVYWSPRWYMTPGT
jgi:heme/copper-type cytochrome/quinol oxidase subunit 3